MKRYEEDYFTVYANNQILNTIVVKDPKNCLEKLNDFSH